LRAGTVWWVFLIVAMITEFVTLCSN
jgi:hypothetical protein